MTASASVCEPWATLDDLFVCTECSEIALLESQGGPVPDTVALENLIIASNILNRSTAFQFGVCEQKIRPCCESDSCAPGVHLSLNNRYYSNGPLGASYPYYPYRVEGSWYNLSTLGDDCLVYVCGGQRIPQVDLSFDSPICDIVEVLIDGVALDPASYRLDNDAYLVRTDGSNWPRSQNLLADETEPGTWCVRYTHGVPPPPEGVRAAAELACQLTLACAPQQFSGLCRLPDNVVSVTRQGITYELNDLDRQVKYRLLNLVDVDRFIMNVNPNGLTVPPVVISPTYGRRPRRV